MGLHPSTRHLDVIREYKTIHLFDDAQPIEAGPILKERLEDSQIGLTLQFQNFEEKTKKIIWPILEFLQSRSSTPVQVILAEKIIYDRSRVFDGELDFLVLKYFFEYKTTKPVITIVTAKEGDIALGWPQCVAQMVAISELNNDSGPVYGVVTTASLWVFARLKRKKVTIHPEIYLYSDVEKILGIMMAMITSTKDKAGKKHR